MAKDAYETQQLVRKSTEEVVDTLKDLRNWTKEMKEKKLEKNTEEAPSCNGRQDVPLRNDRENFEYEARIKRSKTVGDDIDEAALKEEADAYKKKGNDLANAKDWTNAAEFYTKAIHVYGRDPVYHSNLALCMLRLERYEEAIETATKALSMDARLSKAYYRRSQAYEHLNDTAKAIEDMHKVIELEPTVVGHKTSLDRLRQRLSEESFQRAAKEMEKKVWLPLGKNQKYVKFANKNPNYRSKKPMKRIHIDEVLPSMPPSVTDAGEKIPDSVIDKLFNNNTGECTAEPLPSRHTLDFGAFYRRKTKSPPPPTEQDDDLDDDLPPPPTSGLQFWKTWKDLPTQKRFVYLKNLSDKPLNNILGASLDSEILSDILNVLSTKFVEKLVPVENILLELAKNQQTSILSMFLSTEDKEKLRNLFNYMGGRVDKAVVDSIKAQFNLN